MNPVFSHAWPRPPCIPVRVGRCPHLSPCALVFYVRKESCSLLVSVVNYRMPGSHLSPRPKLPSSPFYQAIRDTATSRAMLFGTSALIPEVVSHFYKR